MNLLTNILESTRKLEAGENVQNGFMEFTLNERGKIRHIKSVHISERVIQKALCDQILVPILSNSLIYDNGASVKGKGVHFAIRRLVTHLSRFYRQNGFSNNGYALTIDFRKYFDSIRHDILMDRVGKKVHDRRALELAWQFIRPFGEGVSLGLGSQVSQIFAIFLPNELDHAIKERMRIKFYGRYMDDLYLIHKSKDYLENCLEKIKSICNTLGITVNERKTRIFPLREGLLFLKGKYYLQENGRVLKRATKESAKRMRRKLNCFRALIDAGKMNYADLRTAYQSWRGNYIRRFNAYKMVQKMDERYNNLFIFERPLADGLKK
jgi:retron-type reverse transcriptase